MIMNGKVFYVAVSRLVRTTERPYGGPRVLALGPFAKKADAWTHARLTRAWLGDRRKIGVATWRPANWRLVPPAAWPAPPDGVLNHLFPGRLTGLAGFLRQPLYDLRQSMARDLVRASGVHQAQVRHTLAALGQWTPCHLARAVAGLERPRRASLGAQAVDLALARALTAARLTRLQNGGDPV